MIPDIQEVNFPSYATLHEATVTLVDMGERTIETQVRIDGSVAPDFSGWELRFRGERFVLPTKDPQASKDNTTVNAIATLNFRSWAIEELKRYYFFTIANTESGTAIADKYEASVMMSLPDFVSLFNDVLEYYFGNKIRMDLFPMDYGSTKYLVEIKYSKLWDILTKFYEVFGKRWYIEAGANDAYIIKVNYLSTEDDITDHVFQYGYDGGLLRFERQVQDENITNILLGRGGEKNLPYRYFKKELQEGGNTWTGDPDAIPELADIYFDKLHDAVFRWYVRGWMHNPKRDTSGDEAWDPGHVFPTYTISSSSPYYWAYQKGLTDDTFDPIEYVKDDESIAEHGEHWGALDDNDNIFPTIQNRWREGVNGRIDECVAVSEITTDNVADYSRAESTKQTLREMLRSGPFYRNSEEADASGWTFTPNIFHNRIISEVFTIPENKSGVLTFKWVQKNTNSFLSGLVQIDTANATLVARSVSGAQVTEFSDLGEDAPMPIPSGTYSLDLTFDILVDESGLTQQEKAYITQNGINGTFGIESIVINIVDEDADGWKPTFDIWVKNLWGTQIASGETAEQYAERVWLPILGDVRNNEASVTFTRGWMAASSDYEFKIAGVPAYDTSKTVVTKDRNGNTVTAPSHWRITLYKSDAEYEATGYYIPRVGYQPVAKDTFFFSGIDMPIYYVLLAEEELNTYKTAHLGDFSHVAPTWVVGLDKVRVHTQEQADQAGILADRLKTGILLKVSDPRFTAGQELNLYIQTLTFRWAEPSKDAPYIVPDIELVLSDKVVPYTNPVSQLQGDVGAIQSEYVRVSDVEEIVRRIAGSIYLKKTGEDETSMSPTAFASRVTSPNFRQGGVGGRGWGVYRSNSPRRTPGSTDISEDDEESVIETDRLIVRKEMEVNNLVVNQVSYRGGKEIISAAKIEVVGVTMPTNDTYRCYFDQKQGSVLNLFVVGDIAMCQVFSPDNELTRYYKMVVSEAGADYIDLDGATNDGSGVPQIGDVIVQFGHESDPARQYVIIRDVIGGGFERMLSGLTIDRDGDVYSPGKEYYFAGREGAAAARWFVGDRASGQFAEFANGIFKISGPAQIGQGGNATTIEGNLVQSGTISLGSVNEGQFTVWAGMSGVYDTTLPDPGKSIAAWYGGPKIDHEADASAQSYAKSLFRFDGSGYLASGNIYWNEDGYGGIPGIRWNRQGGQNVIEIDASVKLPGGQQSLVDAVRELNQMFTLKNTGTDANPVYRIKANYGLYSDSFITAGGIGQPGGGGGGSTVSWVQRYPSTGERIATITIDRSSIDVYAPRGGSDASLVVNTDDATITVGSNSATFYKKAKVDTLVNGLISKVSGATAGNVAVFASGGGLADSGIHNSALALLGENNQFTGKNTFIQSIWTHGVVLTEYSDAIYGRTGATNYVPIFRIYTNSADGKGDLNFGIDPGEGGTATHDVSFIGASIYFRNKHWSDTNATLLALQDSAIYAYRNIEPDGTLNLGSGSLRWNKLYANAWYPRNDANVYIEYVDATGNSEGYFKINGNLVATGFITAGGLGHSGGGSSTLAGLNDVYPSMSPADGHVLIWRSSAGNKWTSEYLSLNLLPDVIINNPQSNQVLKYNGSYWVNAPETAGTVTGIQMNGNTYSPTGGIVNLGTVITSHQDISGKVDKVPGATAGNIAIFASGGGLSDSGIHNSALALLSANNSFTGNNSFVYAIGAPAYRIANQEILSAWGNNALLLGEGTSAALPIYYYANTSHVFNIYKNNSSWNPVLYLRDTDITVLRLLKPEDETLDLGAYNKRWNKLYAKSWYPSNINSDDAIRIEYDSNANAFKVVGNLYATGYITAGQVGASGGSNVPVSSNLVPVGANIELGSYAIPFNIVYANNIGTSGKKVSNIYATNVTVTGNAEVTGVLTINSITIASFPSSGAVNIPELTSSISGIIAGKLHELKTTNGSLRITGWREISSGRYEIYTGCFRFTQRTGGGNTWDITTL